MINSNALNKSIKSAPNTFLSRVVFHSSIRVARHSFALRTFPTLSGNVDSEMYLLKKYQYSFLNYNLAFSQLKSYGVAVRLFFLTHTLGIYRRTNFCKFTWFLAAKIKKIYNKGKTDLKLI